MVKEEFIDLIAAFHGQKNACSPNMNDFFSRDVKLTESGPNQVK